MQEEKRKELESWFEVPAIAHFFKVFKRSFGLTSFDIEDLVEALIADNDTNEYRDEDDLFVSENSSFLPELVIYLLRGLYERKDDKPITFENYDECLYDLLNFQYSGVSKINPLLNSTFLNISTRIKVEILYDMINWRLYHYDSSMLTKNLDANDMRIDPVGKDRSGNVYWYFYGCHLYKESGHNDKLKKNPVSGTKKINKNKSNCKKSSIDNDATPIGAASWSLICSTLVEWDDLLKGFKGKKTKIEKELTENLDELYEDIPSIIKQREFKLKKKLLAMAPRRTSNRISHKMQQREAEARLLEQERLIEEEITFLKMRQELKERKKRKKESRAVRAEQRQGNSTMEKNTTYTSPSSNVNSLISPKKELELVDLRQYSTTKEDRALRASLRQSFSTSECIIVNKEDAKNSDIDSLDLNLNKVSKIDICLDKENFTVQDC